MEIVLGILRNLSGHEGLHTLLASHAALPEAVVQCGLCGCEDPVALVAACSFLTMACRGFDGLNPSHAKEVWRLTLHKSTVG